MKTISYSPCKEHKIEVPDDPIFLDDTNTFHVGYNRPKTKSHLKIGNLIIYNTYQFNWFHRMMWKLFFGVEIEILKEK